MQYSRIKTIFAALHGLAMSICLSVCQTHALWQNERNFYQRSYTIRNIDACSICDTKNGWWGRLLPSIWNIGPNSPTLLKNTELQSIFARSVSAVTTSEKNSITTNRKSTMGFPIPISLRWTAYVVLKPPKRGSKMQSDCFFRIKVDFCRRKSATKFICAKTVSGKVVRHSLPCLSCSLIPEILGQTDRPFAKRRLPLVGS